MTSNLDVMSKTLYMERKKPNMEITAPCKKSYSSRLSYELVDLISAKGRVTNYENIECIKNFNTCETKEIMQFSVHCI